MTSKRAKEPLRLVLVGPLPPPAGGMANQTKQLGSLLRSAGIQVRSVRVNAPLAPKILDRVKFVRAFARLLPYLLQLLVNVPRGDIVHIVSSSGWAWYLYSTPALLIAKLFRVPVMINYRGGQADAFLARSATRVRALLNLADVVIVPSGFLQQVFARYGIRSEIVANIVDLERFSIRDAPRGPLSEPHLVVARNLEPLYDNATAIRAFARVVEKYPNAHLTIAGSGSEQGMLTTLINESRLSGQVSLTGELDREQIGALFATAHIMLNPSRADNMPNSLLEGLASGLAIVSTNVGGVPFMVTDRQHALLVPAADPAAMASAVNEILENEQLYGSLLENGRTLVAGHSWEKIKPQWMGWYENLTHTHVNDCNPIDPAA